MLTRKKIDCSEERRLIINCITNTSFLKQIIPVLRADFFDSFESRIIYSWATDYFKHYEKAPEKEIETIFFRKKSEYSEEQMNGLGQFLGSLSEEYDKNINLPYEFDNAMQFIKLQSLRQLRQDLDQAIESSNILKGENLISDYKRPDRPGGQGVSLMKDTDALISAFLDTDESVFTFPGILGECLGEFLRGDLTAFVGPAKRGKSFWLMFAAICAMRAGKNVVFFSFEMNEKQSIRRFVQSLQAEPAHPQDILMPRFRPAEGFSLQNQPFIITHAPISKKGVDLSKIAKVQQQHRLHFHNGDVRIVTFPAKSAGLNELRATLNNMEYYDGIVPDLICVDYADIIAPEGYNREYRHKLDDIWTSLKQLAQERNVHVLTASQAGRSAFEGDVTEQNVAEDYRKIAHVSKMMTLDQTKYEYEMGVMRIRQMVEREGKRSLDEVCVLERRELGRIYAGSKWAKDVFIPKNDKEFEQYKEMEEKYVKRYGFTTESTQD